MIAPPTAALGRVEVAVGYVSPAYAALLATVDQLATVRAAYLAGDATYREYAEATDAVVRARDAAGVDLRIVDLEQQAEQRVELSGRLEGGR